MSTFHKLRRATHALDACQLRPTDLLTSDRTDVIHLELTSKCNLRCTFCAVSQPTYKGRHLETDSVEQIIAGLVERRPGVVTVNGHGETTVYRDWHLYCDRLLDAGIPLHIISNFGRPFSDKELDTLSRFKDIEISCDSHEPETFAILRRGAELPTLLDNIARLRATAATAGRRPPLLSFSCVVSDVNVLGMPEYASFCREMGVRFVNFCNLTKYPDLPDVINPSHVTAMPAERLPEALAALEEAFRRLDAAGIEFRYQEGLLETLRERVGAVPSAAPRRHAPPPESAPPPAFAPPPDETAPGPEPPAEIAAAEPPAEPEPPPAPVRYTTAGREGMTRDCLDPWRFLLIQANREVMPCCWHRPIHSLGASQPLGEVFNNTRMKRLRLELLTGELPDDCRTCPTRGWTPVAKLREKAWRYLNGDRFYLGIPWAMRMVPERLTPAAVEHGEGFYPAEHDPGKPEGHRSWRWTGRRAQCRFRGVRRAGVLFLGLGVNRLLCPDQEITLRLNGRELDRFVPLQEFSLREYAVGPEIIADTGELSLEIATDPTFTPAAAAPDSSDERELGVQVFELSFAERH